MNVSRGMKFFLPVILIGVAVLLGDHIPKQGDGPGIESRNELQKATQVLPPKLELQSYRSFDSTRISGSAASRLKPELPPPPVSLLDSLEASKPVIDAFSGSPVPSRVILPYIANGDTRAVYIFDQGSPTVIEPEKLLIKKKNQGGLPPHDVVFVSTPALLDGVARERAEWENDPSSDANFDSRDAHVIGESDYELVSFTPGTQDDHRTLIAQKSLDEARKALQFVDFSLQGGDPMSLTPNLEAVESIASHVLSLGHGGSILLKVKGKGFIADLPGPDFSVFENGFIDDNNLAFQEFATVEVAATIDPGAFRQFPCEPRKTILAGCVGVMPTSRGGDQMDLSQVGLKRVRFIRITDIGYNKNSVIYDEDPVIYERNKTMAKNYAGVDIDGLKLHHVFEKRSP